MKRTSVRSRACMVTSALCFVAAPYLRAQTATEPAASPDTEETIVLSPFVVDSTEDQGYQAKSTLAGTRVRTELKDVASSISVVTSKFLQDTGAHNAQDLLVYTPNTEIGGLQGNFSGQGGNVTYSEPLANPSSNNRVRGLDSADNTRDYFLTDIPFDTFNVGRIDLQRGPNSILFGVGSPAGIINASVNGAAFKTTYHFENVIKKYGSIRNSIDLNQVLIPNQLSLRFAAVNDQEKYQQKPAFNNSTRYFGALRFDPKIFNSDTAHTSFRANFEHGSVNSNNPRTIPPDDQITRWFTSGTDAYGQPGLNKLTINEYQPGMAPGSTFVKNTVNQNWAIGRTYWPAPLVIFNNQSSVPTQVISGEIPTGWAINADGAVAVPNQPGSGTNQGIAGLPPYQPMAIAPFSHYANAFITGGSYYANKVLTDPSIFDFYNKLLDGSNKHEWQNWNAFNIDFSQTFFDDRLGLDVTYDQQDYEQGQVAFLSGEGYGISVDVNQTLADGSANPNVGKPFVAGGFDGGNYYQKTKRDSTRVELTAEGRASDLFSNKTLVKILGHHRLTALAALDHKVQTQANWAQYATDPSYSTANNFDLSVKVVNYRLFNWVDYIGDNMGGASSASGLNLSNVKTTIAPPANSTMRWFDSHWKYSLNPSSPDYVNPAAPYTYVDWTDGTTVNTSNQANNPANYVGWKQLPVTWMSADNPQDFASLVNGGFRNKFRDSSEALIWQGYLFGDDLVGTYGWRKDRIVNYATNAPIDSSTSVAALDYLDDPASRRSTEGQTRTWGLVYHIPKSLMDHIPGDTSLSLFYNKSHNFKADAPRSNFFGDQIPNPDGDTKEYGATIGLLDEKISLKVTHYETTVHWATLNNNALAGLGGLSYYADLIPSWGYGYAAQVQMGLDGVYGNTSLNGPGDTAAGTQWNYAARDAIVNNPNADLSVIGTPAGAAVTPVATYGYQGTGNVTMPDIVNAWLNMPIPDNFFDFYGITGNRPNPAAAHSTGKLYLGFAQPAVGSNLPGVGGQQPSGAQTIVSTADNVSQGWEYELAAHPIKGWDITVNYSRTQATKTNIDAATVKFMADNLAFYQGPGGQLRLWGASQTAGYGTNTTPNGPIPTYDYTPGQANGSTVGPDWIAGVYNPYLVTSTAQGQSTPEVSPWRLNLITNYTFDHGSLKGFFAGGALRSEAGRILGYKLNPDTVVLDVNQPLIGPSDQHYDLWVGYKRKFAFARNVDWRIQLNLRNVGENSHLVPARYEPDGSLALARIEDGMSWQLTNSFDF